ncbi:MAG: nuclear transport factor 2 family protein [Salinibacterium sp.]|nr:nuclear transport factor 2 family protein [Salinibacterium sp.]
MPTSPDVATWVALYRKAWESNLPDDIRAPFTEDAVYRGHPSDAGWAGHEAIVSGWLASQDAPGTTTFEWHPVAIDGDTAVVRCVTVYPEGAKGGTYDNLWVIRFAEDGRATEYTDWYIAR